MRAKGRVRAMPVPDRDMSARYRLFRFVMRFLGRVFFGFTVEGAERVPAEGALLVAANHRRYADPVLVCMAVPRRIQWMAKQEVFAGPFRRFFFFIGSFPVDREKGARAAIRAATAYLEDGWALGIFPEGTRRKVPLGEAGLEEAPKSGVGMLAARANAAILPVFVGKPPSPLGRLKGGRLRVRIGDPIEPGGAGGRRELSGEVLRAVYALDGDAEGVTG